MFGLCNSCLIPFAVVLLELYGGQWLGFGIAVTAVSLLLPWGLYLLGRLCPRRRWLPAAVMAFITVWNFLLVLLCVGVQGGDLPQAFGITAISYIPVWGIFAIAAYIPLHGCFKGGLICLVCDFAIPLMDIGLNHLIGKSEMQLTLSDYLNWSDLLNFFRYDVRDSRMNVYIFAFGLIVGLLVTAIGLFLEIRRGH